MIKMTKGLAASVLAIAVAGCGDSGGGGPQPLTYSGPTGAAQIQQGGAVSVAGASSSASGAVTGSSNVAASLFPNAPGAVAASDGIAGSVSFRLQDRVRDLIGRARQPATGSATVAGATATFSGGCAVSGSASITFVDNAPEGELSQTDSISASFTNCVDDPAGGSVNGSLSLTFGSVLGDPDLDIVYDVSLTVTAFNFRVTEPGGAWAAIHGGLTMALSGSAAGESASLSGTSLIMANSSGEAFRIQGFDFTETVTFGAPDIYASSVNVDSLCGTQIGTAGGCVTIATPTSFKRQGSSTASPYEGELRVDNGTVTVSVVAGIPSAANVTVSYHVGVGDPLPAPATSWVCPTWGDFEAGNCS